MSGYLLSMIVQHWGALARPRLPWLQRITGGLALLLILFGCFGMVFGAPSEIVEDFESGNLTGWEEEVFRGKTRYEVIPDGPGRVLRAESEGTASALVFRKSYRLEDFPFLSWRWKVDQVLDRGDARTREGDDYAARLYVVFPHWFPPKTRSINYIWANRLPRGSFLPNPYFGNAVMLAVESGGERVGLWRQERRNVLEDYRAIFGEAPPQVGAIAIMTDTDNTGESARAFYDDIRIERGMEQVRPSP